jgi:hypothetical protein
MLLLWIPIAMKFSKILWWIPAGAGILKDIQYQHKDSVSRFDPEERDSDLL